MSSPLPRGLQRLASVDPQLHAELVADFTRLAQAGASLAWAQEKLPALVAAGDATAILQLLVAEARTATGAPVVWAVTWHAPEPRSFRALAGDGGEIPAPDQLSGSILAEVARTGQPVWSDDARAEARFQASQSVHAFALRSVGCVPVGRQSALYLADPTSPGRFDAIARLRLTSLGRLAGALLEPPKTRPRRTVTPVPGIVGSTAVMGELFDVIRAFAPMPWPALVLGESGTGKEAVARALHTLSPRAAHPFVPVNCGAIPAELAESTLFGHERGAFTGADRRHVGLVERVGDGTLFLDEVGELPPALQVKLLRLLQEGTYERVGGDREQRFSGRVLAATHRDLDDPQTRGTFRDDLYWRLAACVVRVPSLSDRRADIPELAQHLLDRNLAQVPGARLRLSDAAAEALRRRAWPGNVRELDNAVRAGIARALASRADTLLPQHLQSAGAPAPDEPATTDLQAATDAFQRRMVDAAIEACGGSRTRAAEQLGVSRQWLHKLIGRWERSE